MRGSPAKCASPPAIAAWCAGVLGHRRDRLVAGRGLAAAEIELAVLDIDGAGEIVGAGVGARRMARDQIVDFQAILDRADAILKGAAFTSVAISWAMLLSSGGVAGGGSWFTSPLSIALPRG